MYPTMEVMKQQLLEQLPTHCTQCGEPVRRESEVAGVVVVWCARCGAEWEKDTARILAPVA